MLNRKFQNPISNTKPKIRPSIKKVASKVFGGVKAVGRIAVKPIKWAGKQMEKELRGEDKHIESFRKKMKDKGWTK